MTIDGTANTIARLSPSLGSIHHWCSSATCSCNATPTRQLAPSDYVLWKASLRYLVAHFGPTIARCRYRGTQHFVLSLIGDNAHGQIQIKIAMQCRTTLLHRYQAPFPCPASCSLSASFATPSVVPSISTAIAPFISCLCLHACQLQKEHGL